MHINKTLELGKIDYNNSGRKNCKVTIDIKLESKKIDYEVESIFHDIYPIGTELLRLSICGNIWNANETDIVCGGQCLDTIFEYMPHNKIVKRIVQLHRFYHLNDMKAGCIHQIDDKNSCIPTYYEYGSKWLYEPIPQSIINEIKELTKDGG